MLILFGCSRAPVVIGIDEPARTRCDFVHHAGPYASRCLEPRLRDAFEQHLIHCAPCQRAVNLGRVSHLMNHHNPSVGMPCAAPTRRKP
jgi:hypothetical protein